MTITPRRGAYRASSATVLGALGVSVLAAMPAAAAAPTDLFFSEYVEGSSNNKAIEIYNGTGADVDLAAYSVELYSNGRVEGDGPTSSQALSGTLAAGDVLVITHASAGTALAAYSDMTSGVVNFNGDDALVLKHSGTVIDSFGQVGVDPGTEWPGGGLDDTLTRNADVCAGDASHLDAFDAALEWTASATDTFSGLGAHTASCSDEPPADVAPTVASVTPADGAVGVATDVAPVVTFSEDVVLNDAFSLICGEDDLELDVTGEGSVYTITPLTAIDEAVECELTVAAGRVEDVDGDADVMEADFVSTFATVGLITPISAVEGTTDTSPLVGRTVTVEGVVVGDYEGASPTLRGFYVQSRDDEQDEDPETSEAVFVYNGSNDSVAVGDEVQVTGVVAEYQGQTQLGSASIEVLGSGASVTPTPVSLPFPDADHAERYEGMLVEFAQELTVTETYLLGRFNEVMVAGDGKLDQPSAVVEPGPDAIALQEANNLNRIKVDDFTNAQNLDPMGLGGGLLDAGNPLRSGSTVTGLSGVFTYTWGGASASGNTWRVRPVDASAPTPDFVNANPRPTEAPEVGGDVKVAAFNVLNFFLTTDEGDNVCGPVGYEQDCRGADSEEELERQTAKLVSALVALDADVIGMAELENTTGVEPLAVLAEEMNEATGTASWSYVDTGIVGTDTIRVGFLYDSATVSEVGDFAVLDNSVDESFDDDNNRPSVAQTFEDTDGDTFTVVANHWKSKGSCPSTGENADQGDGASCWNGARTAAATALVNWLDTYPTGVEDDDYIIMGDLNSYGQEDPIQVLREAGYVELADDYSYVYDGQWGSLDYAFASATMAEQVSDAAHLHINSDEPTILDYNTDYQSEEQIENLYAPDMYRTSDHDPVLIGLDLGTTRVQVLGTNDFHGRILPTLSSGQAGAAVMAGAVAQLESEYANSVFTAAGDLIGASTFESFVAKDKPTIDALNAMGLDVSAVGNHEFDQGYEDLINRVMGDYDEETNPYGGATWEYLGANVRNEDGSPALDETWMVSFDNGTDATEDDVKLGFVGVVTEETPSLVSPAGIEGLEFEDEAVAANRAAEVLESEGADAIILLVHEGAPTTAYADAVDTGNNFGKMISELDDSIDAVVSGHTHLAYAHEVPVQGWIDEGRAVTERPVVSAGQYGMYLDQLILTFDNATDELVGIDIDTINLTEKVDAACTSSCELVFPADPDVQAIVDAAAANAAVLGAQSIGELTEPLYRARTATNGEARGGESTLGNAVATVQLWATEPNGAQIAFMNPGGLRADLLGDAAGTGEYPTSVSYKQANTVQPFGNTLATLTLTGAGIKAVLEQQWQPDGSSRPFLKLGISDGFEYTYDPTAARGERILQMWLDGEAIDLEAEYTVAANAFLAAGGDNFTAFRDGTGLKDSARVDFDAMVDYLAELGSLGTEYDQHAVGVTAESLQATAGEEISFDLSSLMFTGPSDLHDENVVVSLGGDVLGTFPVTNEIVTSSYDDNGTASVTVTIPEGLEGEQLLEVEGDVTATSFAIAIDVAAPEPLEFTSAPQPTITGTPKAGSTLRVAAGTWTPTPSTLTYQWYSNGVAIKGATGITYKVATKDRGKRLTVAVTASLDGYVTTTETSAAVKVLKVWTTAPKPTILGSATAGSTLRVKRGVWNPGTPTYAYQWYSNGVAIKGATGATYKVTTQDRGKRLTVAVTASRPDYESKTMVSAPVVVKKVFAQPARPLIKGTVTVGTKVVAPKAYWSPKPGTLKYQWMLDGKPIKGATSATYTVRKGDYGHLLKVKITAVKTGYETASVFSIPRRVR
ncbi:ExeM/NucH family extracellular endonuclease [Demequina subtropica]|uniref:ExeM/NucH family extracellular endonuclease n=1 Tax=Demequina subtropica TaxID=1638989 RepID=UPI0014702F4C|nr:ExeM/NucH family extracellular endonuclease [Demequina subtropica]